MNIAYIAMQFPVPSETFLSLDVEALGKQGHKVTVYGLRPGHADHQKLMRERGHENLDVYNFSAAALMLGAWFSVRHPLMFLSLVSWVFRVAAFSPLHLMKSLVLLPSVTGHFFQLYQDRPDVVHLFWGHYPAMVGFLVKRYMPEAVVSQFLGAHDLMANYPGSAAFSKQADLVFTHSRSNLPLLESRGIAAEKVNVVLRGTKLDFHCHGRLERFDDLKAPVFLTAARLIPEKGTDDVLRVFSQIVRVYPQAHLYVAGEGPDKPRLLDQAASLACKGHVTFLGHIKQAALIELMTESHFFLLMSRYPSERLPNAVKEAMYQQCVVLTTATDGIDELIENGVSGLVVEKGATEAGLELILDCLQNQEKTKTIASQARQVISAKFDVQRSMQVYADLWGAVLKKRSS